MYGGQT
ncbi:hypothetical protein YPPY15_1839, partial [Yersinia pestis PY-15]